MILNKSENVSVTSNIATPSHPFTVHQSSLGKIMSILTDHYSNPEKSMVREYLTNALDATLEHVHRGGALRPIEITTPGSLSQTFKIRDFGIGMSFAELTQLFTSYGYSTKEDTNVTAGQLGLGSKSALTYTQQFIVTSWHNGEKHVAVISLDGSGTPELSVVSSAETDEPNGVEIAIPAQSSNNILSHVHDIVQYWPMGHALVNGCAVGMNEKLTEYEPGYWLGSFECQTLNTVKIVMGGVPYPTNITVYSDPAPVVFVEMGAVDFTPSREELRYTERTQELCAKIRYDIEKMAAAAVKARVDKADNAIDAAKILKKSRYSAGIRWRGIDVSRRWSVTSDSKELSVNSWRGKFKTFRMGGREWYLHSMPDMVILAGSQDNISGQYRKIWHLRSRVFGADTRARVVIVPWNTPQEWIIDFDELGNCPIKFFTLEEVKAVKVPLPQRKNPKPREIAPFETSSASRDLKTEDDIQPNEDIFWISSEKYRRLIKTGLSHKLKLFASDKDRSLILVIVPQNRQNTFNKRFPNVKPFKEHAEEVIAKLEAENPAPQNKFTLGFRYLSSGVLNSLDINKINDARVRCFVEHNAHEQDDSALLTMRKLAGISVRPKETTEIDITSQYPLVKFIYMSYYCDDDAKRALIKYFNDTYAELVRDGIVDEQVDKELANPS